MTVLRGVEDNKAYEKGMNNTTTARGLLSSLKLSPKARPSTRIRRAKWLRSWRAKNSTRRFPPDSRWYTGSP